MNMILQINYHCEAKNAINGICPQYLSELYFPPGLAFLLLSIVTIGLMVSFWLFIKQEEKEAC